MNWNVARRWSAASSPITGTVTRSIFFGLWVELGEILFRDDEFRRRLEAASKSPVDATEYRPRAITSAASPTVARC